MAGTAAPAAPDERVRAQAAELAGFHGDQAQGSQLVKLLDDPSPQVRAAAHGALVKLNAGTDLGQDADAWRAAFHDRVGPAA